ncbi:hypothetical protein ACGF5O_10380 [Streptomyces sp. NPDC048291]|uniref:hypothetical protein n=1 Tax=Streptomyces sp. NPDC048291 TaxID=3365530 RepID=UPI003711BE0B
MTSERHDAEPSPFPDPSITERFKAAAEHLEEQHPLLTAEAQAAMLAWVRETAAQLSPAPEPTTGTPPTAFAAPYRQESPAAVSAGEQGGLAILARRRRATAFAQALEEQPDRDPAAEPSGGPTGDPPAAPDRAERTEQGELSALATGLAALPKPELDPEVKVVQRAQLVAAMEAMLAEGTLGGAAGASVPEQRSSRAKGAHRAGPLGRLRPRSRLARGLVAGGLSVGVAAGAFGGVAAASSDALPGDSLYGLKRGIEDFKLDYLSDSDDQRGQTYLDQASTRLMEVHGLLVRQNGEAADARSTTELRVAVTGLRDDTSEGVRLLLIAPGDSSREEDAQVATEALATFAQEHRRTWTVALAQLPPALSDVSREVTALFDTIDRNVVVARTPRPPAPGPSPAHLPGRPAMSEEPGRTPPERGFSA